MNRPPLPLLALLTLGLLACGGGASSPSPKPDPVSTTATGLDYNDPTSGTYRFKRNTQLSQNRHLVLELWGPESDRGCAVMTSLRADSPSLRWSPITPGEDSDALVANGTVFNLGNGLPILKATRVGDVLVATVAQKGYADPRPLNGPLLRIAVDLVPGSEPTAGTVLPMSVTPGRAKVLFEDGALRPVTVTLGTITAR